MKITPAQKIRDYLKLPLKDSFIKKQEERHGRDLKDSTISSSEYRR